jgi:hypothetical protein
MDSIHRRAVCGFGSAFDFAGERKEINRFAKLNAIMVNLLNTTSVALPTLAFILPNYISKHN